jgi:peptide/nickel transport system permease protein
MRTLIIRRVLVSIPLIVVVTGLTFVLESLVPGNTARAIVGTSGSPAAYQQLRAELGLNNPLW